jgi:hypothetical protein
MLIRPNRWREFQHYKDRCPPWIKLHSDLLKNRDFVCLPIASKALAPMLWLLAGESKEGQIDATFEELQFRLHISRKDYDDGLKPLIDKGFFIVDSGVLAECEQVAIPETERETDEKRETKKEIEAPEGVSLEVWTSFVKQRKARKAQITDNVMAAIQKEASKAGWPLEAALNEIVVRNWQSFKAEWVADKQNQTETVYQKSMRLRVQEVAPDIARQEPYQDQVQFFRTIDITPQVQLIEEQK